MTELGLQRSAGPRVWSTSRRSERGSARPGLSRGRTMDNAARSPSYAQALERLRRVGLRPTRQRLALVKLLFEQGDRHITAEQLHEEAQGAGVRISLATVYNSLQQF